jgi:hypothetical protein
MNRRISFMLTGMTLVGLALVASPRAAGAQMSDLGKYPDWRGHWGIVAVPNGLPYMAGSGYDPHKPAGRAQQAPLTPEYQAIFEANMADQALGSERGDPTYNCLSPGMPRIMTAQLEVVVLPETTYIIALTAGGGFNRWIYTDGRDFPANMAENPQFSGYSIGRWVDEDGDGRYNALIVETRGMKGPRAFEATGIPLHEDNQTIVKERIYLDQNDRNMLHDEITTVDHALTRPWTVTKDYRRTSTRQPLWWSEIQCAENNVHVTIGDEVYFLNGDGLLMPSKKDQPPPDLRYFKQPPK